MDGEEKEDFQTFLKRPTVPVTRELGDHQTMMHKKARGSREPRERLWQDHS